MVPGHGPSLSGRADPAAAPAPLRKPDVACGVVRSPAEVALHFRIRHDVFVSEQRIFDVTDRDDRDDMPATIHVLGTCDRVPAGAVRLYPLDGDGHWKGDRLAVLVPFRAHGLGAPLVRYAVATAAARGGVSMDAFIQPPNVAFFQRLGWTPVGGLVEYCGRPHQHMTIDLTSLPHSSASLGRHETLADREDGARMSRAP